MPRIVVIDDEPNMLRIASDLLKPEGYEVETYSKPADGLARLRERPPDLVLLDVRMPGMDGFQLLKELKSDRSLQSIPVLMVSVKKEEADVVAGLELGAEDYVRKPYQVRELVARIRVALRRPKAAPDEERLSVGPIELDRSRYTASIDGKSLTLRPKEFELLAFFLRREGRILTRATISEAVWKIEHIPSSRRIDFYVDQLRKKLGPRGKWIQSLKGVGYRFEVDGE